ncbi:MAG TPA: outer membrane protein assembly factor BamD [Pyrinomonadaceae bacterium]
MSLGTYFKLTAFGKLVAFRHKLQALGLLLLALAVCAGAAWGCGWTGFSNSVRFGGYSDDWRASLPPLPTDSKNVAKDDDGPSHEALLSETNKLWDDAGSSVAAGELEQARRLLERYVERTAGAMCDRQWEAPKECRDRRNSALDRLDALNALGRGARAEEVRAYLEARAAYDEWLWGLKVTPEERPYYDKQTPEQEAAVKRKEEERATGMREWGERVEARLRAAERDPSLADNAAYLRAVGVYRAGVEGDVYEAFESVARLYPRGEKREAALFMAGRAAMESSASYLADATATSEDPCREQETQPGCRDDFWRRARKNFTQLVKDYPRGRYVSDARGWLAYLDYRVGDTSGALAEYFRVLADGGDTRGREVAALSLKLMRYRASDAELDALERELEDEPEAALAYAYYSVYNYSSSQAPDVPEEEEEDCGEGPYRSECEYEKEKKRAARLQRAEQKEMRRAADFASRMVARYPGARAGGAFLVRLADAQLSLNRPKPALEAARRALASGVSGEERARAWGAEGVAEYALKDYVSARVSLARAAEEAPRSKIARRARELAATAAEEQGDLAGALEQYLALGYDPDVSYFVDVLMTPDQLASFLHKQDVSPRTDELLYALGLRFMRAGRYEEARAAFSRVHTTADSYFLSSANYNYFPSYSDDAPAHPKLRFRHTFWDEFDGDSPTGTDRHDGPLRDTRVYADWLLRDMQTLSALERLQGEVGRASVDEEKAEALYQLASYFYEGELLFYNPAAWRGMRAEMIGSLGEHNYRAPAEAQKIWEYVQEHEGAARALALYLEVVRLYPRTRAARDSLYTAVLCHQRLANFNGYWRTMYDERGLHAGARLVTLADVRREYPNYRLPAQGRWQPSTRTVSGQPAWPAPSKPKKLTGVERARGKIKRAELRVGQAWELFGEVYEGRARRWTVVGLKWSVVGLTGLLVLFVFRRTRRPRRFLYRQLVRHLRRQPMPRARVVYAPTSTYAAHHAHAPLAGLRASFARTAGGLFRLALHERGRAALALNLLTHGLLTVLLWAVLWAMRG